MLSERLCLIASLVAGISLTATGQSVWHEQINHVIPGDHTIAGQWQKGSNGLRTTAATSSRIAIPVKQLPREYDFRTRFTRHSGQH